MSIILIYLLLGLLLSLQFLHPLLLHLFLPKPRQQSPQRATMQGHPQADSILRTSMAPSSFQNASPSYSFLASRQLSLSSAWWLRPMDGDAALHRPRQSALRSSEAFVEARSLNACRLIIVDQYGFGHFRTVQAAVNSIPFNNKHYYTVLVAGGFYEEKVSVPNNKPLIKIQGLGMDSTVISWHDTAATFGTVNDLKSISAQRPLGTFRSATVAINAPNFVASGITFQNTAPAPVNSSRGGQAVAVQVSGDQVAFYDCGFRGRQDTLYDHKGRHYFRNCFIEGAIDFIFGDGKSLYKACEIHAVGSGFITAQKRQNASDDSGFSFVDCKITSSRTDIELYLGRAWGPFSRVVYASCYMEGIIAPQGWHNWGYRSRELTVSYSEFNCSGPGAWTSKRVIWSRQLDSSEASPFVNISFVQGDQWLPYE